MAVSRSADLDHLNSFCLQCDSGGLVYVARHTTQLVKLGEFMVVQYVFDEVASLSTGGAEDG